MAGDAKYDISVDTSNALRGLDGLIRKIEAVDKEFQNFSRKLTTGVAAVSAALLAAGVSAGRFADEMADVAAANETTVDRVVALGQALALAGGKSENAGRAFMELTKSISEANAGNAKTIELFNRLGVSMTDLGTMSRDEIQNKVLRSLSDIRDPIERNAAAMQLFGKAMMGVDLRGFSSLLDEQNQKYAEYRTQLETAGAALGKLDDLLTDIRVAAAVAFEPLFKAIRDLKIDTESLITTFKVLVAILAAMVGPAILAGLAKLVIAFKTFNDVVSKNKLLSIVSILLSAGGAAAAWLGLNKEVETTTAGVNKELEDIGKNTANNTREQDGYNQMVRKEIDSLTKARQELERQTKATKDKIDLETRSLTMSAQELKIEQQLAEIRTQTAQALLNLEQEFNKLAPQRQADQRKLYEAEREAIKANSKAAEEDAIKRLNFQKNLRDQINNTVNALDILGKAEEDIYKLRRRREPMTEEDEIRTEAEINTRLQRRKVLLDAIKESKQAGSLYDFDEGLLNSTELLTGNVNELIDKFRNLKGVVSMTPEAFDEMRKKLEPVLQAIDTANKGVAEQTISNLRYAQEFETGWKRAYLNYNKETGNAAKQAEALFNQAFKGLEDVIVNFVKTGKLNFREFLSSIAEMILRSQIQRLIAQMFGGGGMGGGGPSIFSSIGSFFSNLFAGFFANGGMIPAGQFGVVGERGPEIVSGPAQVTPMAAAGGGTYITYNINAVDTQSFQQALSRDPGFLYAVTEKGRRQLPGQRR